MAKKMSPADIAAVQRGMAERPDSIPTLATINVPTLVIAGEDDSVPLGEFELMHQRIPGSQLQRHQQGRALCRDGASRRSSDGCCGHSSTRSRANEVAILTCEVTLIASIALM